MRVEVSLDVIENNVRKIKAWVGNSTGFTAIVKSNAYGHGSLKVADAAIRGGATHLGVSTVEEALSLREHYHDVPILVMSPFLASDAARIVRAGLTPYISNIGQIESLQVSGLSLSRRVTVHLEIDTGMGRSGCLPADYEAMLQSVQDCANIELTGIATHFSSAESDGDFTRAQLSTFQQLIRNGLYEDHANLVLHAANSAGSLLYPEARMDMIRPGLLMYGIWPCPIYEDFPTLTPAMEITARILHTHTPPEGWSVSYNRTFRTDGTKRFATIDAGYGDGYPRELSNKGYVLIHGQRAPIVGRVCMDVTVIDVTEIPHCVTGDTVTLIGENRSERIRTEDLAKWIGTTEHDITTRLTGRSPIKYQ